MKFFSVVVSVTMCWCAAPAVTPYALEPLAARNSDLVLMVDLPALCNHPQVRRAFETHSAPDGNSKWKKLCDRVRNAGFQWEDFLGRYLFYANTVTETGGMVLETVDGGAMRLFEVAQRNSSMRSNVQSSLIAGQKLLVVRGGYFRPDSALLLEGKNLLMVMVGITPVPQTKSREVPPLLEGRAMGGNLVRMLVLPRGLFSVMEMQGGAFPQEFRDLEMFDLLLSDRAGRLELRICADFSDSESAVTVSRLLEAWIAAGRTSFDGTEQKLFDGLELKSDGARLMLARSFEDELLLQLIGELPELLTGIVFREDAEVE